MTVEGQVVLRSNVSSDALRSFGEDLINFACALAQRGDEKSGFPQSVNNSDSPANAGQRPAVQGERTITPTRFQFVTGLGTRTSSQR